MTRYEVERIDANLGSMLIGILVSAVLLGVSYLQTFYYYMDYPKDPWYLKVMVFLTAFYDSVHLAFITHTIYHYLVSNFSNEAELGQMIWSVVMEALLTGMTGCIVQLFYLQRVWRLSHRNYIITGILLFLILGDVGCGTAWVVLAMECETYQDLVKINPLTITINAFSVAADVLIAASLCYMLHRSRTGFKKSDSMINRLILFVVNTGVLTSCCAIASLIALVASPGTLIYACFYFCIGRLYTNSFLATLNARNSITSHSDDPSQMLVSMPPSLLNQTHSSTKVQPNISIRIDTTKERDQPDTQVRSKSGHHASEEELSQKLHPL